MNYATTIEVGPVCFRVGSDWRAPIAALDALYASYPAPRSSIPHFTVRLEAGRWWRRFVRPQVGIGGDFTIPDALPLPLSLGLLAAEMAMNLQVGLGERRFLLLHAATVEKGGKALILTGESGSGKSTLAAMLGERGWRLMGDEFALIDPASGDAVPFPRPVSLKNDAIAAMEALVPVDRFGPRLVDTPKGDIRHLVPRAEALAAMHERARPALILFPRFGHARDIREVGLSESFVRLTQASTNYVMLGEAGHSALARLVTNVPARAIDYPDAATGLRAVERLWKTLA